MPHALALAVFCYRVKKYVGAYLAVLGRCDALVFTGGIGEHSAAVRVGPAMASTFGFVLDDRRNDANEHVVSADGPISVLVVPTDEELAIAEHTAITVAAH